MCAYLEGGASKGNLNKDRQYRLSRDDFYKTAFETEEWSLRHVERDLNEILSDIERVKGVDREKATTIFWRMDLRRKPPQNPGLTNSDGKLSLKKLEMMLDFLPTPKKLRTQVCVAFLRDVDSKARSHRTPTFTFELLRRLVRLAANPKAVGEGILDLIETRVYMARLRSYESMYGAPPKSLERKADGRLTQGSIRALANPTFWSPTLCILADEYADDIAGTDIALVIEEGLQYSGTARLCEKVRGNPGQ